MGFEWWTDLQERYPEYRFGVHTYAVDLQIHRWGKATTLSIGAFCSIAKGVQIFLDGNHRLDWVTTYPFSSFWEAGEGIEGHPGTKGDVCIGNDVWIGTEALILSGVTIGNGAVIGARTVVAKSVPPYAIAVGNPMRIVRYRFPPHQIEALLELRWWDWPDEDIAEFVPLLLSDNLQEFLDAAECSRLAASLFNAEGKAD